MSRATKPYIMDAFGHLHRPKPKRRKRCIVCKELTHSSLWMSYTWDRETLTEGIHCKECAEEVSGKLERMWE